MRLSGLKDKLYWRRLDPFGPVHCFKKVKSTPGCRFLSLCGYESLMGIGVQKCRRPPVMQRCGICDGKEMKRRGWEESGPES